MKTFNETNSLTTGSTKDSLMLPQPRGVFGQAFTDCETIEVQWQLHRAGERYLLDKLAVKETPTHETFEQALCRSINAQIAHVESTPFWPIRAVYWFFGRRNLLANKSIEEQHGAGMIIRAH